MKVNVNMVIRIWPITITAMLIATISCSIPPKASMHDRPNVIFIMSDDQGYADLGCYGSKFIQTPVLDQMAREGIRFTQAYVGSPVCAPTRCSLLTGLHSGHITRRDNRTADDKAKPFMQRKLIPLRKDDFTIGSVMKSVGYKTGCIGKWGLGNPGTTGTPDQHGFDYFYGYLDQVHAHSHYPSFLMENLDTVEIPANRNYAEIYAPDLMLEASLDFISQNSGDPFFLYLPFTLPHGRYEIPNQGVYEDKPWSDKVRNYAAMITRMDHDIGTIFDLLKELNIDNNTVVFFTSDNGPNPPFINPLGSNEPFRGIKRQLLEGGIRTPMIVRWPDQITAGVTSDYQWAFWDVMATIADICDAKTSKRTDGISIVPTLLGKSQAPKEHLYWEYHSPFQQAVRVGNWKGIRTGIKDPLHLFDLTSDPRELNNLANQNPEVTAQMVAIMLDEHIESEYWPDVDVGSVATKELLFEEN